VGRPQPPDQPHVILRVGPNCWLPPGGRWPLSLTFREDCVLQTFLTRPCLSLPELEKVSGVSHAAKVLTRLAEKYDRAFAPALRLPGGKGRGGYGANVRVADGSRPANGEQAATTAAPSRGKFGIWTPSQSLKA
jgi:hypothetical protein